VSRAVEDPIDMLYLQLDRTLELLAAIHQALHLHHGSSFVAQLHQVGADAAAANSRYWRETPARRGELRLAAAWPDALEREEMTDADPYPR
jgi:hypothetical protein